MRVTYFRDQTCLLMFDAVPIFSELTQIVTDVISDPTLPRTADHPCKLIKAHFDGSSHSTFAGPKCRTADAVFFQAQSARSEVRTLPRNASFELVVVDCRIG